MRWARSRATRPWQRSAPAEGDLSLGVAGCSGRQYGVGHVSGPVTLSANAAPELAKRINRTLQRADQNRDGRGQGLSRSTPGSRQSLPTQSRFRRPLNAFEIMKAFIEAGAAGVHYEDQLASEKKSAISAARF